MAAPAFAAASEVLRNFVDNALRTARPGVLTTVYAVRNYRAEEFYMTKRMGIGGILEVGLWAASLMALAPSLAWAQPARNTVPATPVAPIAIEQPDANRTRDELTRLLEHYPPTLRNVFATDPSLLGNQAYLAPYPALVTFLNAHPEIQRTPAYYVGSNDHFRRQDNQGASERMWERLLENLSVFAGFAMAIGLLTWLIRTVLDYRRWHRLTNIQTDVHTRLLDRFTGNDEVLAYIKSPAGSKFLESSPITLDAGARSVGAPLGRILWSVQAGLVLMAGGIGLDIIGGRVSSEAAQPINAMGILGIALGVGFVLSSLVSFLISHRLGLIETPATRAEPQAPLG